MFLFWVWVLLLARLWRCSAGVCCDSRFCDVVGFDVLSDCCSLSFGPWLHLTSAVAAFVFFMIGARSSWISF